MLWTYLVLVLSFVSVVSLSLQTAWSSRPNPPAARVLNQQIRNDLNQAFRTHRESKSVDAWRQSGYTPTDVLSYLRDFKRTEPLNAFCEELAKAKPIDLVIFEKELPTLPCKKALSAKTENFWFVNRMLFQTARDFDALSTVAPAAVATKDTLRTSAAAPLSATTQVPTAKLAPRQVALTFEGDLHSRRSNALLSVLKQNGVKAIYFPSRKAQLERRPDLQEWARHGHSFGTILESSKPLHLLPLKEAKELVDRSKTSVGTALSPLHTQARFILLPDSNGSSSSQIELQKIFLQASLQVLPDAMDSYDWKLLDARALLASLLTRIEKSNGGIVRLHADQEQTLIMLPVLLERLRENGYELVTFSRSG